MQKIIQKKRQRYNTKEKKVVRNKEKGRREKRGVLGDSIHSEIHALGKPPSYRKGGKTVPNRTKAYQTLLKGTDGKSGGILEGEGQSQQDVGSSVKKKKIRGENQGSN